ncbi:MAG: hypothetical protein JST00_14840 [Deltaproteobacteria bacterium]|nr:hypothetical protein [Deltaproteobacteria bacterium]
MSSSASPLRLFARAALVSSLVLSCSSEKAPASSSSGTSGATTPVETKIDPTKIFDRAITKVVVEIDYAPDAAPNEAAVKNFGNPWELFRNSALAVFDGKKTLSFPEKVKDMQKLDDVAAKSYSAKEILDVAASHRDVQSGGDTAAFYVVFLNGYYVDEAGAEQKDVLGVSIGNTGVIGMFKPAISDPIVEQVALIHYFGHAVGFVDNGVPVAESNPHADPANPRHCVNDKCVMHFAVEAAAGAQKYAGIIRSAGSVLYDQGCLSDARILESKGLGQ